MSVTPSRCNARPIVGTLTRTLWLACQSCTVRSQRRVRMRRHLGMQGGFVGGTNQAGPPGTWPGPMRAGHGALAAPAAKRGWIDPEELGNVTHAMTVIHRGQGSFTDVV